MPGRADECSDARRAPGEVGADGHRQSQTAMPGDAGWRPPLSLRAATWRGPREAPAAPRGCRTNPSNFRCVNWSWDTTIQATRTARRSVGQRPHFRRDLSDSSHLSPRERFPQVYPTTTLKTGSALDVRVYFRFDRSSVCSACGWRQAPAPARGANAANRTGWNGTRQEGPPAYESPRAPGQTWEIRGTTGTRYNVVAPPADIVRQRDVIGPALTKQKPDQVRLVL